MKNYKEVTREELYNDIWTQAVSKVCIKYGVSDTAIRKKCKQYNIPLPDNKYWALLQHGRPAAKTPLPSFDGKSKIIFNITYESGNKPEVKKTEDFEYLNEAERMKVIAAYKSIVSNRFEEKRHPLIEKHKAAILDLKKQKADLNCIPNGWDRLPWTIKRPTPVLDTYSVSENEMYRAYMIYDALIKALENVGAKVIVDGATYAVVRGEKIRIRIREKYLRTEKKNKEKYSYENWDYTPTGELIFWHEKVRSYNNHEIRDSASKKLENKIDVIFKSLFDQSDEIKLDRIRQAEQERLREIRHREEQEIWRLHYDELSKVKSLIRDVQLYQTSQMIRNYIDAVKKTADTNTLSWCEWATQKADWIAPTIRRKDEILNDSKKEIAD